MATQSASSFSVWLLAARPKTLWAAVAPVLMGTGMAFADHGFHPWAAVAALFGAVMIQVGTNYANDYFDHIKGSDTSERLGPTRATAAGLVTPSQMKRATIIVFVLAALAGAYLVWRGGWPILVIGLVSILLGVLYTGGPKPIGYVGLGDLFVLVFFGPVAVAGTYYVQTLTFSMSAVIAGLAPGLFSVAILTVNNLRDVDNDARAGKRTLAVRFGKRFARREYVCCLLLAAAVPVWLVFGDGGKLTALTAVAAVLLGVPAMLKVLNGHDGPALNMVLAKTGQLLLLYSLLFTIGWIL